jgi:hypothetical protein
MIEMFLYVLKWGCFWQAIGMLLWMGYRMAADHPANWVLLDACIVIGSILLAERYHNEEY